jgi:hypothetical protein
MMVICDREAEAGGGLLVEVTFPDPDPHEASPVPGAAGSNPHATVTAAAS